MTVRDFCTSAHYLYHITPKENVESILSDGLLVSKDESSPRNTQGIYVSRTDNPVVLSEIIHTQLCGIHTKVGQEWVLITIDLSKNKISERDIAPDLRTDDICVLSCKIMKDVKELSSESIKPFHPLPLNDPDYINHNYGVPLENLTEYNCIHKIPCDPMIDQEINGGVSWSRIPL